MMLRALSGWKARRTSMSRPSPFILSIEEIDRLASRRIVERGVDYALSGRVVETREGPGGLEARVQGTGGEPYVVRVLDDGDGGLLPECSCPFDWEPFCKHAVAALARHAGVTAAAWKKIRSDRESAAGSPEEDELEARRERGKKEPFRITLSNKPAGPAALRFEVRSSSTPGRKYEVRIRSLELRINDCTCRDFETSMLGTCKHVEAVLHRIQRMPAARRRSIAAILSGKRMRHHALILSRQKGPCLVLRPAGGLDAAEALAAAPDLRRFFDERGVLRGDPERAVRELKASGAVGVDEDAAAFVGRLSDERRGRERARRIESDLLACGGAVPGFHGTLFPYQAAGTVFLASRGRALLADDMGLGKTVQAIAAAHALMQRGEAGRALVVCPASLKRQWADEIARFTRRNAAVVSGMRAARKAFYAPGPEFTIANYEIVLRDADLIAAAGYDLLIVDEAQRIKNWRTRTAEAVKAIAAPLVFVLTGTPLENRLDDLYSIMQLVDRRVLGPLWAFNESFIEIMTEKGKGQEKSRRVTRYRNLGELRRRLRPVMMRRDRGEVLTQLPERTDSRYYVPLTRAQFDLMVDAEAQAAMIASRARTRPLLPQELRALFAFLQIARMACNAVRLVDRKGPDESPKLDEFERIVEELCVEGGRKAVVFTQWEIFQRMAAARVERLGVGHVRLHGGVPSEKRGDLIARFRDDPDCRLFLSTDAGGVGLNLQSASAVVNLDLPWNPAVLEQRIGRVHRLGQRENVTVLLVIADNSFERKMEKLLAGKQSLFDATILPDAEAESVVVPSVTLGIARELFAGIEVGEGDDAGDVGEEIARRYAADPAADAASSEGVGGASAPQALQLEPVPPAPDPAAEIGRLLGPRLRCVLALPSGHAVAVVDRDDVPAREAARSAGMTLIEEKALDALSSLGPASPLAAAKVVEDRRPGAATPSPAEADGRRAELAQVARRRMKAAESMAATDMGAEALSMAASAVEAALRAAAADDGNGALGATRLLHEVLLPGNLVTVEQAGMAAKVEGLARAYAESTVPPPTPLVAAVLDDARGLLASLAAPPPMPAS
jgi:superfamily II DNA or RNA helicase